MDFPGVSFCAKLRRNGVARLFITRSVSEARLCITRRVGEATCQDILAHAPGCEPIRTVRERHV